MLKNEKYVIEDICKIDLKMLPFQVTLPPPPPTPTLPPPPMPPEFLMQQHMNMMHIGYSGQQQPNMVCVEGKTSTFHSKMSNISSKIRFFHSYVKSRKSLK